MTAAKAKSSKNGTHGKSNAVKLLTRQHREVEALFGRYKKADDANEKLELVTELSDALAAHATIEEKLFYPAVYVGKLVDQLHEAVEEHLAMKRIISDLLPLSPSDDTDEYDAKVKVLSEQVEHHVKEEEEELFPVVTKTLDAEKLEELGMQMDQMFKSLIDQDPRENVPGETDTAAPLPESPNDEGRRGRQAK